MSRLLTLVSFLCWIWLLRLGFLFESKLDGSGLVFFWCDYWGRWFCVFFVGAGLFLFLFYLASFFFSFRKCTQVQEQEIIVKIKYLKGNSRFFSCSWYYSAHGNEASGLYWNWREIYYVIRIFTTCMISWKVNMSSKEFANFFETSPVYC